MSNEPAALVSIERQARRASSTRRRFGNSQHTGLLSPGHERFVRGLRSLAQGRRVPLRYPTGNSGFSRAIPMRVCASLPQNAHARSAHCGIGLLAYGSWRIDLTVRRRSIESLTDSGEQIRGVRVGRSSLHERAHRMDRRWPLCSPTSTGVSRWKPTVP